MKGYASKLKEKISGNSGVALLGAIILISVVAGILLILVTLTLLGLNISKQRVRQLSALDVSEAGINYYLWHLVHAPGDYCDGNPCVGTPPYGPYVHNFTDNSGNVIGTYTLWIAPPGITTGGKMVICHVPPTTDETLTVAPSAVQGHLDHDDYFGPCEGGGGSGGGRVVVESRGDVSGGNENRTIVATLGIPSFAQYAVVANDTVNHIRFGVGTEVWGPIHNNGGVRFDGVAHALVTSALAQYRDPDTGLTEPGVYTTQPNPSQVFLGGTNFPVPPVDFNQVTANLNDLKQKAQDNGLYYGPSGASGYHIVLKQNDTFDIYRVNSTTGSCWIAGMGWQAKNTINSQTKIGTGVPFPADGIIFVEDNLWIDGRIDGAWLTVAAATLPESTDRSIFINSDLKYTNLDGRDKLGLIAQKDISVGLESEGSFSGSDDQKELRIDAALLAQKGRVGRNYYNSGCSTTYYKRNIITVYGSIATNQRYGFSWVCGSTWCSGYDIRNVTYDQNLSVAPPPAFPTIGNYAILDWREE